VTLFLHIARRALLAFVTSLAVVVALFLVVDFAENASAFSGPGWVRAALELYANRAAAVAYQTAPAAMLLAAAVTASGLRRTREYTAMRALGLGPWRVALPVLAVAALVAAGLTWMADAVVVGATARADEIMATRFHRGGGFQRSREPKRWFRGGDGHRVYHLRGTGGDGGFERVTVLEVTPEFRLARRIDAAQAQGLDVVLHVLEGSKTGLVAPGIDGVRALLARFPSGLRIIADFCQMRPFSDARPYLELGAAIVATGSKFMGGPAFSGAVVLPPSWRRTGIVEDLKPGTLLRWEAALTEGAAYWRLDPLRRAVGLSRFTQTVRETGADFPEVDVLDDAQPSHIVTLRVRDVETDGWMNQKQLERLGRWLAQDAQPLLPPRAKSFEIRLAGQRCLLGQALTVGPSGALRLAANAQRLAQLAESPVATAQLHQDLATLLSKIALIRRYWPKNN
jgi:hypothetical protein